MLSRGGADVKQVRPGAAEVTGRDEVIRRIAAAVDALHPGRTVLVGIDGVDGAGKTVFADELASALRRPAIRAGVDSFHQPRAVRYRRGRNSPDGYFHDSFDIGLLRRVLIDPLRPGGDGWYRSAAFDHRTDSPVDVAPRRAPAGAALVFDGIFLHRTQLRDCWDYSVFLRVGFDVSVGRCALRDGTDPDPAAATNRRYVQGQRRYLSTCDPEGLATVVIDNTDLAHPVLVRSSNV